VHAEGVGEVRTGRGLVRSYEGLAKCGSNNVHKISSPKGGERALKLIESIKSRPRLFQSHDAGF
jgi:hypothetical protein